jgi:predicted metal-dependent TIM-barrel fold hydrolase
MDMSGQLHAPVILHQGKEPSRTQNPVRKLWSREQYLAPAVQPVATPTELSRIVHTNKYRTKRLSWESEKKERQSNNTSLTERMRKWRENFFAKQRVKKADSLRCNDKG